DREPPISPTDLEDMARDLDLDLDRFARDLADDELRARVAEDLTDGRGNGVTGTPTLFVDGIRYDGAWDYHSLLEALERPIAARVHGGGGVSASLPTSAGLVLVLTAMFAILCANTPLAPLYDRIMGTPVGVGPLGRMLVLSVRDWCSEGLLAL